MAECPRCGTFTDNPSKGNYPYCNDCLDRFEEVRENGVVVQQTSETGGYQVYVAANSESYQGGTEDSQTDALARGKYLSDQLNVDALFEYEQTGSQWILEEYLREHPAIRKDVVERVSRVPTHSRKGLVGKFRSLF